MNFKIILKVALTFHGRIQRVILKNHANPALLRLNLRRDRVLLPVWISAYRYRDKAYRFIVNGQTGEVSGEAPVSWWKVFFLGLGILVLVVFFLYLQG